MCGVQSAERMSNQDDYGLSARMRLMIRLKMVGESQAKGSRLEALVDQGYNSNRGGICN